MSAAEAKQAALRNANLGEVEAAEKYVAWLIEQQVTGTMLSDAEARVAALRTGETGS